MPSLLFWFKFTCKIITFIRNSYYLFFLFLLKYKLTSWIFDRKFSTSICALSHTKILNSIAKLFTSVDYVYHFYLNQIYEQSLYLLMKVQYRDQMERTSNNLQYNSFYLFKTNISFLLYYFQFSISLIQFLLLMQNQIRLHLS